MKQAGLLGLAFILSALAVFYSCQDDRLSKAQEVVDQAIQENGAYLFATSKVSFNFRGKGYSAERQGGNYIYKRFFQDSTGAVEDMLVNSAEFSRTIDGQPISLTEEWQGRYGSSVNSVLYFVEILYRLNDPAVNKSYEGTATIKGEDYHTIKVTFGQENGGEDFEDEYLYWIHTKDFTLDYLAYNYLTDGGGVRFREAFDREKIKNITFQNYINYKPESKETPLQDLPALFENGQLQELSRIINEDIVVR